MNGRGGGHQSDQRPVYPDVESLNNCHDLFHKGGCKLSACAAAINQNLQQNPLSHFCFLAAGGDGGGHETNKSLHLHRAPRKYLGKVSVFFFF